MRGIARPVLRISLALYAGMLANPAIAQLPSASEIGERAGERACLGAAGQEIGRDRLGSALLLESGLTALTGGELVAATNRMQAARSWLLATMVQNGSEPKKLHLVPAPPPELISSNDPWLFAGDTHYKVICPQAEAPESAHFPSLGPVVVRQKVDDLTLVGDALHGAPSAKVSWDDSRSTGLDGKEKRTRTLTVDATVALALGNVDRYAMLYGDYTRSRARVTTKPDPTKPEDDGRADDVDAFELGALASTRIPHIARATGRLGVIFDSTTGARYLAGGFQFAPTAIYRLGLCNLNMFGPSILGMKGRCKVALEADVRQVLRAGQAKLTAADTLLALGGSVGIEFSQPLGADGKPKDGLTASLTYRYLNMVSGRGPDIDRVDATLAYRVWAGKIAFDFGLTYADGIERKSLADEHRIAASFGVLY